jgi:hypothetical protein
MDEGGKGGGAGGRAEDGGHPPHPRLLVHHPHCRCRRACLGAVVFASSRCRCRGPHGSLLLVFARFVVSCPSCLSSCSYSRASWSCGSSWAVGLTEALVSRESILKKG